LRNTDETQVNSYRRRLPNALQEIDRLWDVEAGTPESDILEILVTLVEAYEKQHYELPPPEPIAALEYFMESRRWTRKEVEPYNR
jgi:HTH-type transcriptional regulator / antitoxin HigA